MIYNDLEKEVMANAIQPNMRTPRPLAGLNAIVDNYLKNIDFQGTHILDIGPGQCDFLDIVKGKGAVTYGIDFDPAVVKLGEMRGHNMTFCDLTKDWPFKDMVFDGIFCRSSINCYWFVQPDNNELLKQFLDRISKSLKSNGWMWILPWNKPYETQENLVEPTRATIAEWIKQIQARIEVMGQEEKVLYQSFYTIPVTEVWVRNCALPSERGVKKVNRWKTITSYKTESTISSVFGTYEACRKRILAGTTVSAERATLSKILEMPEDFLSTLSKFEKENMQVQAYSAFIASRPKSDVLYSYLAERAHCLTQYRLHKMPGTKGRTFGWDWGYWGRSAVYAFNATKEYRFADLVLDTYEVLLNERDDSLGVYDQVRNRVPKCWGVSPENISIRTFEVASTGMILLPICDLLLSEAGNDLSASNRERLIHSVTECLDEFDGEMLYAPDTNGGYYISPFDGKVEALNHVHTFAAALVKAYQLTGENKYRRDAESIAKYFLSACILEENNTYSWSYFPSPEKMQDKHPPMSQDKGNLLHNIGGEAFYKAGITIEFPIAAYDVNICFSNQDMCRIADTFLKNVFLPNNNLNVYISSNKTRTPEQLPQEAYYYSLYVLISGCSLLDSIRPQIRSKLVSLFGHRPDLFSKGWFSGVAGSMALARFMSKTKYRLDE
ncbi:MAG: class I SAM-dependent methyltransferase [Candidatus Megaira endosymbiont of Mesostigma viride]|jgi:hypothetical protein|nr:MAG: class I SAM-dependent methyltransferase [Candidatus Megaira endosymbiont of Mesostigma viride]HJK88454.1 methyltransferase domain-containing protein [Candidatus Megaira endosymbiont of Mesostigma viride]